MFSLEETLSASTDMLLDETGTSRKLPVLPDEPGDVSTKQQLIMSVMHTTT